MPLFDSIIFDQHTDIFGYCINESIVAFSIVKRYDADNAESLQFAWDYQDPDARLGIKSIEHECAFYKELGYKYLYLGKVNDYKTQFDGYEQIGNPYV